MDFRRCLLRILSYVERISTSIEQSSLTYRTASVLCDATGINQLGYQRFAGTLQHVKVEIDGISA
jgi:hypothetical protein